MIKTTILSYILILSTLFAASCETRTDTAEVADIHKLPTLTVENNRTIASDSGKIEVILSFPLLEQYDNAEKPYWEFRNGVKVDLYDKDTIPHVKVTSKYAKYDESSLLWELKDSVVVLNDKNDMLETELLYWDQKKDLIYTDRFVKMTSAENITQGFGFESDSHMRRREIKKVSAVITYEGNE